jgi:hypothetical protein
MNQAEKILASKPSAYRSMQMAKLGLSKATNKDNKGKLKIWRDERWINLTGYITDGKKDIPCGTKGKNQGNLPSVCRPSKKVNKKTTSPLADELIKKPKKIVEAVEIKKRGKRIDWLGL